MYNYSNPSEYKKFKNLETYQDTVVTLHSTYSTNHEVNTRVLETKSQGNITHYQGNRQIIASLQDLTYPSIDYFKSENINLLKLIACSTLLQNSTQTHSNFLYSKFIISPTNLRNYVIIGTIDYIFVVDITDLEKLKIMEKIKAPGPSSIAVYNHIIYIYFAGQTTLTVIDMRDSDEETVVFLEISLFDNTDSFDQVFIFPAEKYLFLTQPNQQDGVSVYLLSDSIYPTYLNTWNLTSVNSIDLKRNMGGQLHALITTKNETISEEMTLVINRANRQSLFSIDITDIYNWEVIYSADEYGKAIMLDNAVYLTEDYIIAYDNSRYEEYKLSGIVLYKLIESDLHGRKHYRFIREIDIAIPKISEMVVESTDSQVLIHITGFTHGYVTYNFDLENMTKVAYFDTFAYYKDTQDIGALSIQIINAEKLLITDTLNGIFLISRIPVSGKALPITTLHNLFPLKIECDLFIDKKRRHFTSNILFYDSKMDIAILSLPEENIRTSLLISKTQPTLYFDKIMGSTSSAYFAAMNYYQGYITSLETHTYRLLQEPINSEYVTACTDVVKYNTSVNMEPSGGVSVNKDLRPIGLMSRETGKRTMSLIPVYIISKIWNKYLRILFKERQQLSVPNFSTLAGANIQNLLLQNLEKKELLNYRNRPMFFAHHTLLQIPEVIDTQIYKIYYIDESIIFLGYVLVIKATHNIWEEIDVVMPDEYISQGYLVSQIYPTLNSLHTNSDAIEFEVQITYILDKYRPHTNITSQITKNVGSMLGISVCPYTSNLMNRLENILQHNAFPEMLYQALFLHFDLFSSENKGLLVLSTNKDLNPLLDEYDIQKGDIIVSIEGKSDIEYTFPSEVYLTENTDTKIRLERYRFEPEYKKWHKRTVYIPYVEYVDNAYYV